MLREKINRTNFFDEKVTTGKEYEYRVIAVNEGGESDASSGIILKAKPEKDKPKFDKSGLFNGIKEIKVKAGEPIVIELPIDGSPAPEVIWTKDGKPLDNNKNG